MTATSPNNFGLGIREYWKDKTIFMTGSTGFFGKVVLEMLLRKTDFKRCYIMIRHKQGTTLEQRMNNEIFKTQLFEPLYSMRPDARQLIKEKVIPVSGDLVGEGLGLKPEVRQ